MYNVEELVAMLQNGKTAEDIAAEMTKALNEANAQVAAAKKAEIEAARKRDAMAEINDALYSYLLEFHPNATITKEFAKADSDGDTSKMLFDLSSLLDNMVEMFELVDSFNAIGSVVTEGKPEVDEKPVFKATVKPSTKVYKDPIDEFLDMFVRK